MYSLITLSIFTLLCNHLVPEFSWGKWDMSKSSKKSHFVWKMNICSQMTLLNNIFYQHNFSSIRTGNHREFPLGIPLIAQVLPHAPPGAPLGRCNPTTLDPSPSSYTSPRGHAQSTGPRGTVWSKETSCLHPLLILLNSLAISSITNVTRAVVKVRTEFYFFI